MCRLVMLVVLLHSQYICNVKAVENYYFSKAWDCVEYGRGVAGSLGRVVGGVLGVGLEYITNYGESLRTAALITANSAWKTASVCWGTFSDAFAGIDLSKIGHDMKVNTIVTVLTEKIRKQTPSTVDIDITDVKSFATHARAVKGTISDLKSIKVVDFIPEENTDELVRVRIGYSFKELNIHYDEFNISVLKAYRRTGKLDIVYEENRFEVVISIPHISELMWRGAKNQCIIYFEDFKAVTLTFDECKLHSNPEACKYLKKKISDRIEKSEKETKTRFEDSTMIFLHNNLPLSKSWICKREDLKDKLMSRGIEESQLNDLALNGNVDSCGK